MDKTADYFKIISDMRVVLIYMIALSMEWKSQKKAIRCQSEIKARTAPSGSRITQNWIEPNIRGPSITVPPILYIAQRSPAHLLLLHTSTIGQAG